MKMRPAAAQGRACERRSAERPSVLPRNRGKSVTLAAVACAMLFGSLACSSADEPIRRAQAEVRQAMAEGDLEAARETLARLRKSEPEAPGDVQRLATLMVRAGEAPQALWLLEDALQRFSERHDLRLLFGRVALLLGEASRALAKLEPIEAGSLFHPDALVLRARAILELGDLAEALAILEEADELYPELPDARKVHFEVLFQEQRYGDALAVVEEAKTKAASEEELRELRVLEARARGVQGETEEAVAILREIAQEAPERFGGWRTLVRALTNLERRDEAVALIEASLEEDPERLRLYPILADVHLQDGRRDQAKAALRRFIEVSQSPSAYLQMVRFHRGGGDTEQALEVVDQALRDFPDQPMLQSARIEALLDLDRLKEARATLAAMESEDRVGARLEREYLRGRVELAEGDAESASERLRELVETLNRADTQFHFGRALEQVSDLAGAQRAYATAQQHMPGAPEPVLALLRVAEKRQDPVAQRDTARRLLRFPAHRTLGFRVLAESLLQLDNLNAAEGVARRFVEQEPEELDAHLLLSRALWRQRRVDQAQQVLDKAQAQHGAKPEIVAERAAVLAVADRSGDAIAALERALQEKPDDLDLMEKLAVLHFEKGDFEAGSALIDRALEQDPGSLQPLRLRAVYTAVNGPLEVARRDAERYLAKRPGDHELHFRLGSVYARLGLTEKAVEAYRRSAELAEGAFAPRNNLAVLFQASGDLDQALELAHEAYERAQGNPDVLDTLGWIYFEKGLVDRSISVLEEAHDSAPGSLGSLHLALAYREAGRTDEAQELLSDLVARADAPTDIRRQAEDVLHTLP